MKYRNTTIVVLCIVHVLISYMFDHAVLSRRLLIFFHLFIFSLIQQLRLFPVLVRPNRFRLLRDELSFRRESIVLPSVLLILANMIMRAANLISQKSYFTVISYSLFFYSVIMLIFGMKYLYLMRKKGKGSSLEKDLSTYVLELIPNIVVAIFLANMIPLPYPRKIFIILIFAPAVITLILRSYAVYLLRNRADIADPSVWDPEPGLEEEFEI